MLKGYAAIKHSIVYLTEPHNNSSVVTIALLTHCMVICTDIVSKEEALWEAVDYYKPDFIIGCETWLKPTITDNEVLLTGYKIHHKDHAC